MNENRNMPGLKLRLEAVSRLKSVLAGAAFVPIGADTIEQGRERALANRIVTTALRRHGQISHILETALAKGVPPRSGGLEAALRVSIAQLLFMDDIADHSAIHTGVELVRSDRRAARYDRLANGVLRNIQRERDRYAALPGSMLIPAWMAKIWRAHFGEDAVERFAGALLDGAPLDLTLHPESGEDLLATLGGAQTLPGSLRLETRDAPVPDLPGYAEGRWWVQDTAAAIPARLLDVKPGESVLDICAAPGGKTAQLAAAGARVTALDISHERMARVRDNLARLDLHAELSVGDALEFDPGTTFDAILLDAPCTATGTLRRHPEVLWHTRPEGAVDRAGLQRKLLARAAALLKPGGRLVYCVCSLLPAEGEEHLKWIAAHLPGLVPSPVAGSELGGWSAPVLESGAVRLTPALAVPGLAEGTLDGFFIARFTKSVENVLN